MDRPGTGVNRISFKYPPRTYGYLALSACCSSLYFSMLLLWGKHPLSIRRGRKSLSRLNNLRVRILHRVLHGLVTKPHKFSSSSQRSLLAYIWYAPRPTLCLPHIKKEVLPSREASRWLWTLRHTVFVSYSIVMMHVRAISQYVKQRLWFAVASYQLYSWLSGLQLGVWDRFRHLYAFFCSEQLSLLNMILSQGREITPGTLTFDMTASVRWLLSMDDLGMTVTRASPVGQRRSRIWIKLWQRRWGKYSLNVVFLLYPVLVMSFFRGHLLF